MPLSLVQIVGTLAAFGLGRLGVRDIPAKLASDDTGNIRGFVRGAFLIALGGSILAAAAMAALALFTPVFPEPFRIPVAIAALLVPATSIGIVLRSALRGFGAVAKAQVPGIVVRPAIFALILATLYFGGRSLGAEDYLLLSLGALAISFSLFGIFLRPMLSRFPQDSASGPGPRGLLVNSLPFLGLGLAALLQGQINTLLLGMLSTPEQAGLYQPVARLVPILLIPIQAAGMRYAPRMSEFWATGQLHRLRSVTWTFTWTTTLLTSAMAALAVAAGPYILAIFGEGFAVMQPAIAVLAGMMVVNAAFGPVAMLQVAIGQRSRALTGQLSALVVNVVLGLILIPQIGAYGSVIAMSAGLLCGNLLQSLFVWKPIGMVTLIIAGPPSKTKAEPAQK